jgi:hypothetical protein
MESDTRAAIAAVEEGVATEAQKQTVRALDTTTIPPEEPDTSKRYDPSSTAYKQGFHTEQEYLLAQRSGTDKYGPHTGEKVPEGTIVVTDAYGNPYLRLSPEQARNPDTVNYFSGYGQGIRISVTSHDGKELLLKPEVIQQYAAATGKEQFQQAKKLGIIPEDAKYVASVEKGGQWGYLTGAQAAAQSEFESWLGAQPKELQEAYDQYGANSPQYRQALAMLYEELPSGELILRKDFEALSPDQQRAAVEYGLGAVSSLQLMDERQREAQVAALARLRDAGFVDKYEGPYMRAAGSPPIREYTIPALAEFTRNNSDGMGVLRNAGFGADVLDAVSKYNSELKSAIGRVDAIFKTSDERYGGPELSLGLLLTKAGITDIPGAHVEVKGMAGGLVVDDKSGEVLTQKEQLERRWGALSDEQKAQIAPDWDADFRKGSYFSAIVKGMEDVAAEAGIVGQLAYAPILPVATPIAKQLTLDDAKEQLSKEYAPILSALKDYVNPDGTFDLKRYDQAVKTNPSIADDVAKQTGYEKSDDIRNSMEYYNYATTVSPKEWVTAGLVGALDALMAGGGGALAGLGVGGRIAGQALSFGTPLALGALQAPDVAKMIASPAYSIGEKLIAGLSEVAMFSPLAGYAVRGAQFLRTISRPDYVPARSMIVEAATPRVIFSATQVAKLTKAGAAKADFVQLSNEIEKAMTAGAKSVTVNFKGVQVRVNNANYQAATEGGARFTGVPDITVFTRGEGVSIPLIKEFYNSFKVALEPIRRSYNEGQLATRPGIVEVRIADSKLVETLMSQKRGGWKTAKGGYELELEGVLPSLDELRGLGYDLIPIPGKAGRGVAFDMELGPIEIRRFTLAKVVDNPTGLVRVKTGSRGDGGVAGVGDLHATTKFQSVFDDINSSFAEPVIKGNPNKPSTWSWNPVTSKGRTIVVLGDSIDRGSAYTIWRTTLNRLSDEAARAGDKLERLLGNHELAYLSDDAIKGVTYTDKGRAAIKQAILDDIASGKVKAAVGADGKLFTHAGVSRGVFPELSMSQLEYSNGYLKSAGELMRKACSI